MQTPQTFDRPTEKPWYLRWWAIILEIMAVLVLIFLASMGFYIFNLAKSLSISPTTIPEKTTENKQIQTSITTIEGLNNYWIGVANNPRITIVEFSDFACTYCRKSFTALRQLTYTHPDIKIIFRDYPLHDESLDLAMAARCAGEQNLFWQMHDKLFINQGVTAKEDIDELANQIGVDMEKYQKCFTDKKYLSYIQKDYLDGQILKIQGTPTWFFNGQEIKGDLTTDKIETIINEIK